MRSWKFQRAISIRTHASPNCRRSRVLLKPIKKRNSWRCGAVSERRPRLLFCRSGLRKDRVEILQEAMRKVFKDPEFHAEFKKLVTDDVSPLMPEELMKV